MHATHSSFSALSLFIALATAACAPAAPANPSWEQDVKPILAANCVRCHRSPAQNGAPPTTRLDVCADAGTVYGAATMAQNVLSRARLPRETATAMPPEPATGLSSRQIRIIERWIANGAPCTGTAAAPSFVLLRATEESVEASPLPGAHVLALRYAIDDPAHNLVSATVVAMAAGGELHVAPEPLRAGTGELVWALDALAAGTYEVFVTLDDGSEIREVRVGTFAVPR